MRLTLSPEATRNTEPTSTGYDPAGVALRLLGKVLQWSPALAVLSVMAAFGDDVSAPIRLALASVVLYAALKITAATKQSALWSQVPAEGWLWYSTLWPGMDLMPFANRAASAGSDETATTVSTDEPVTAELAWLGRGFAGIATGTAILAFTVFTDVSDWIGGWLMVGGLLSLVHFGYADLLSWGMRRRGFPVRRLFRPPERAITLNDFWTRRWNRAFVEMDQILFMPALRRFTGGLAPVLMLGLSGVMHELALSYPAGAGWGLPMLYFAGHGVAMQAERSNWFLGLSVTATRWWTRVWVLAPVALVFHRPFRDALPLELLNTLKGLT